MTRIGPILQAAAQRRKTRQRRNFCRQSTMRDEYIRDLLIGGIILFAVLTAALKLFGA